MVIYFWGRLLGVTFEAGSLFFVLNKMFFRGNYPCGIFEYLPHTIPMCAWGTNILDRTLAMFWERGSLNCLSGRFAFLHVAPLSCASVVVTVHNTPNNWINILSITKRCSADLGHASYLCLKLRAVH